MDTRMYVTFRTKMALLAGLITGGIVIGACYLLWNMTYGFAMDGLDRDMEGIAEANMDRLYGRSHWSRLDESLALVGGEGEDAVEYKIWAELRGRYRYISEGWPNEVDPTQRFEDGRLSREGIDAPEVPVRNVPLSESNKPLRLVKSSFSVEYGEGERWRVGVFDNYYASLAVAVSIDSFDARMAQLKYRYYLVAPLALILAVTGAWFVAGRSMRPVEKLTSAVERVSAEDLGQRIDEIGHEREFRRLVGMFNEMMQRMESSFNLARRFSADASHELKTPLSRLQMELEAAMEQAAVGSAEQETYSHLLDEIGRLSGIIEKLMLLSFSDAGKLELRVEKVNLSEVVENVVEDCCALADADPFELSIAPSVYVNADAALLEQAVQNLCSNALKYGAKGGVVRVSLEESEGRHRIEIANEGEAIPDSDWEKIFERFYRRDTSRTGDTSGAGLGLGLSREIVRAHGGELRLKRSDGEWTVFEVVV